MKPWKVYLPFFVIILVWLIFSTPYIVKQLVPFPSRYLVTFFAPWQPYYGMAVKNNAMPDIITQIYPWRHLSIESLKTGDWGLWNPNSFAGTVHAGNYQSAVLNPFNILFFALPFLDAWSLLVLLQPLVSGLGMYLLLRCLERSRLASLIVSVSAMFYGFMTVWMAYGTLGWAVAYLPFIFTGIVLIDKQVNPSKEISPSPKLAVTPQIKKRKAVGGLSKLKKMLFSSKDTWWPGTIIALGLAGSFLSGHFQMSLYVLIAVLGFSLFRGKKVVLLVIPYLVLGLLVALPQLLVAIEAFTESGRSADFLKGAGIPWHYLITVLAPDFFGNPVTRNDWFGQYAEWSSYIGVVPLFFAGIALVRVRSRKVAFFVGVAVASILLAVYSPISQLFYQLKIPVLSTSVATRLVSLFSFALLVMASYGLDEFIRVGVKKPKRHLLMSWVIIGGGLGLLWLLVLGFTSLTSDQLIIAKRNLLLPSGFLVATLLGYSLGLVIKPKRLLLLGFLVLTAFDMLRFSSKWMPFEERAFVFPEVPVVKFIKEQGSFDRLFGNIGNEFATYYRIPSVEGYDAMYKARYGEFISAAGNGRIKPLSRSVVQLDRGGEYTQRWLNLLGVRFLLHRISDGRNVWVFPHWLEPGYTSRYRDEHYEIFENTTALPRAYFVDSYHIETNPQRIIDQLTESDFDIRREVVLEKDPQIEFSSATASATIVQTLPQRIVVTTNSPTTKLLVMPEIYDRNWKAWIDGQPSEVYRANYVFRAVVVPPGQHTIEYRYQSVAFMIGMIGLLSGFFVLLVGGVRQLLHGRRFL